MKNVILTGMPGVGKSTVGVVLAKVLGYDFVDSDLVIQKRIGKKLHEIISEEGIEGFLTIEDEVNSSLNVSNSIVATGGSAIYGETSMQQFFENDIVVYLSVSYETLEHRLGDLTKRGVVIRNGQTLKDLYEERCPLYDKYAHITINEENLGIRETVKAIEEALEGKL